MNKILVGELMQLITTDSFNFEVRYSPRPGEVMEFNNVVTTDRFKRRCTIVHGDKSFLYYGDNPRSTFQSLWDDYNRTHSNDFAVLLYGLYHQYDPQANYDKHSVITNQYEGSEENELSFTNRKDTTSYNGSESDKVIYSGTESNETTYDGSEGNKTVISGSETNTHYDVPNDSTTEKETSKDTKGFGNREDNTTTTYTNRKDTDTKSFTNREDTSTKSFSDRNDELAKTGTETNTKMFTDRVDTMTESTYGNIGVATVAGMMAQEIENRGKYNIGELIIDMFINEYCAYIMSEY